VDQQRSVSLERLAKARFRATNPRGGTIDLGEGEDAAFTPVELLLAAIAGCTGIDVDYITGKRAEALSMSITVCAQKLRDEHGNHLTDIEAGFEVVFPDGRQGDAARAVLPDALAKSHDRLCTVSRTVELPTPVTMRIAQPASPRSRSGSM